MSERSEQSSYMIYCYTVFTILLCVLSCVPTLVPLASFLSFEPTRYFTTCRPDDRALRRHTLYPSTTRAVFSISTSWILQCKPNPVFREANRSYLASCQTWPCLK